MTINLFKTSDVIPTIDKISLYGVAKEDIINDDFEMLISKHCKYNFCVEEFKSDRFMAYKRLIKISYKQKQQSGEKEVYTIAIMIGHNGMNECRTVSEARSFKIEWNPNKFKIPPWLVDYFFLRGYRLEKVKNIDLAFDFKNIPIKYFKFLPASGNTKIGMLGTVNNLTYYIGFADKSKNRIKIYDKRKERKKYEETFGEMTRLEITLDYEWTGYNEAWREREYAFLNKSIQSLNQVFITGDVYTDPMVYMLSCVKQDEMLTAYQLMSKDTRTKYKRLLKETSTNITAEASDMLDFINKELWSIVKNNGFVFLGKGAHKWI